MQPSTFNKRMNATANHTLNSTSNATLKDPAGTTPAGSPTIQDLLNVTLASSFYMYIMSLVTIVGNGLLLFLFFKSPSRWFRQPSVYFLAALALADFLTGLIPEPLYATCFMMAYFRTTGLKMCNAVLFDVAQFSTLVTVNVSILIVLAFTATQCVVVMSPLRFAPMITSRKVITCVALMWLYVALFQASYHLGVPYDLFYKIDMFLNTLVIIFTTITLYVLLRRAFQQSLEKSLKLRSADSVHQLKANRASTNRVEKHFVILNGFLIALYIVCLLPNAGYWFANVYWELELTPKLMITTLICDNVLIIKFALDPFLFAWRLPKYSQALKKALCCHCGSDVEDVDGRVKEDHATTRTSYVVPETEDSKL